jgi:hypothetical protein
VAIMPVKREVATRFLIFNILYFLKK